MKVSRPGGRPAHRLDRPQRGYGPARWVLAVLVVVAAVLAVLVVVYGGGPVQLAETVKGWWT